MDLRMGRWLVRLPMVASSMRPSDVGDRSSIAGPLRCVQGTRRTSRTVSEGPTDRRHGGHLPMWRHIELGREANAVESAELTYGKT